MTRQRTWPRWRRDRKELCYHSIGAIANPQTGAPAFVGPVYAVSANGVGGTFEHAAPKPILNMRAIGFPHTGGDYHTYAVSPDGQRFLYFQFVVPSAAAATAQTATPDHPSGLMIATNWAASMKK